MDVNLNRAKLMQENAIKMTTIAPTGSIPGILQGLLQKYINPTNVPNYLELQKAVVNSESTAASLEYVAGDLLKSEMAMTGSDLRLKEIINLMTISVPVNADRFSLEVTYIEMLQNLNKLQLKEYGSASKLGLKDIEDTLAGLEGLETSSAYTQDIAQQIETLIVPLMASSMNPAVTQQWMNFIANLEYMMISTQILSDLARRANELKPNTKILRRDSNNQTGYQRPEWMSEYEKNTNDSSREKLLMLESVKTYIDQNILSLNIFTGYNPTIMYDNLIDLSSETLKYLYSFTTNSAYLNAPDSDIMKKLAVGTHIFTFYDLSTGNTLASIPFPVRNMLGIIACAKSLDPNFALNILCNILGVAPIAYTTNPMWNPGSPYMLYLALSQNNPNIFFGHLLVENRSSDIFEFSKFIFGTDGSKIPLFNMNDITYLQQQIATDVGNMYKTPQGISSYLARKGVGVVSTPGAFNDIVEIICQLVNNS